MTKEQIDQVLQKSKELKKLYTRWGEGLAFFIALHELYPEEAEAIRGTMFDPYHRDEILIETIKYLKDK